jgi:hypothetical protein
MNAKLLRVGEIIINIDLVEDVKPEGDKLYIHFLGGKTFRMFQGAEAKLVWEAIVKWTEDLQGPTSDK